MNSIVRERAARQIYSAYMNKKYEYPSGVLAAGCCPLPQPRRARATIPGPQPRWAQGAEVVSIPCAIPCVTARRRGTAAAGDLGTCNRAGKKSTPSFPSLPSVPQPPANPQRDLCQGHAVSLGPTEGLGTAKPGGDCSLRGPNVVGALPVTPWAGGDPGSEHIGILPSCSRQSWIITCLIPGPGPGRGWHRGARGHRDTRRWGLQGEGTPRIWRQPDP